jgi:drug/metabolite transporter (DMT)-like permease
LKHWFQRCLSGTALNEVRDAQQLKAPAAVPSPAAPRLAVRPIDPAAVICLILCCAAWGVNQVAIKVANEGVSPLFQAGFRCGLAAIALSAWMAWRGIPILKADGAFWPGTAVGALLAGNFVSIGLGLELTGASRGILFLYAAPFLVALGAHFLIPGDRLTRLKLLGLVAAFCGLALSTAGRSREVAGPSQSLGDAYCFVGAVFWAVSTLVVRTTDLRWLRPEKILFYQLIAAAPLLFLGSWMLGEPGLVKLTPGVLAGFAFSTVIVVFVSYVVWFWLLQTYPASEISAFTFLAPVFGVFAGYTLLDEQVGWSLAGALALVTVGIALVTWPAAQSSAS